MSRVTDVPFKGTILGFEEFQDWVMRDVFGDGPFYALECRQQPVSFVLVDPFFVSKDYKFDINDATLADLEFSDKPYEELGIFCIVRVGKGVHSVNLCAPLILNLKKGIFRQIVLSDEQYGTSTLFKLAP